MRKRKNSATKRIAAFLVIVMLSYSISPLVMPVYAAETEGENNSEETNSEETNSEETNSEETNSEEISETEIENTAVPEESDTTETEEVIPEVIPSEGTEVTTSDDPIITESVSEDSIMETDITVEENAVSEFTPRTVSITGSTYVTVSSTEEVIITADESINITLTTKTGYVMADTVTINGTVIQAGESLNGITYTIISDLEATLTGTPESDTEVNGITVLRKTEYYPIYIADGEAVFYVVESAECTDTVRFSWLRCNNLDENKQCNYMMDNQFNRQTSCRMRSLHDADYSISVMYIDGIYGTKMNFHGVEAIQGGANLASYTAFGTASIWGPKYFATSAGSSVIRDGWRTSKSNPYYVYSYEYCYHVSPNVIEIVIVMQNYTNHNTYNMGVGINNNIQLGNNQLAPIYNTDNGFIMSDGVNEIVVANTGSDILFNGYNPVTGISTPAIQNKWWGPVGDMYSNCYTNLATYDTISGFDSAVALSWSNIILKPYECRVYSMRVGVGPVGTEDLQTSLYPTKAYSINSSNCTITDEDSSHVVYENTRVIPVTAFDGSELSDSILINGKIAAAGIPTDGVTYSKQTSTIGTITLNREKMISGTQIEIKSNAIIAGVLQHESTMQGNISLLTLSGEVIASETVAEDGSYQFVFPMSESNYILMANVMDGNEPKSLANTIEMTILDGAIITSGNTTVLYDGYLVSGTNSGATTIQAFTEEHTLASTQSPCFYTDNYLLAGVQDVMYIVASDCVNSSYTTVTVNHEGGATSGIANLNTLMLGGIVTNQNSIVYQEDGSIAVGATVKLIDAGGNCVACGNVDSNGGFLLTNVPNGVNDTLVITMAQPSMQSYTQTCNIDAINGVASITPVLDEQINLSIVFSGIVKQNGIAIPNASVYLLDSNSNEIGRTTSLVDGSYYIAGVSNGNYLVIATLGEGNEEVSGTTHVLVSNMHPTCGDINILSGHLAYGHITPVLANVEVRVRNAETEELIVSTKTNIDGNFSVGGMQPNTCYLITAAGYGRSCSQYVWTSGTYTNDPQTLKFMNDIVMSSGMMLAGNVTDSEGRNVEGATVVIRDDQGNLLTTVITNAQGNYACPSFKGGTCNVVASKDNTSGCTRFTMTANGMMTEGNRNIVLQEGMVVQGRIFGTNHIGIYGAKVVLKQDNQVIAETVTGNAGWFWLAGVPENDSYVIEVMAQGIYGGTACVSEVTVTEDGILLPDTLTLESGTTVSGMITYENGNVICDATIRILSDETVVTTTNTDSDGDYLIPNLQDGTYRVEILLTESQKTLQSGAELTVESSGANATITWIPDIVSTTDIMEGNIKTAALTVNDTDIIINNTCNVNDFLTIMQGLDSYVDLDSILQAANSEEILEQIILLNENYQELYPMEKAQLSKEESERYESLINLFFEYCAHLTVTEEVDLSEAGIAVEQSGLADVAYCEITTNQMRAALSQANEGNEIRFTLYVTDVTANDDEQLMDDKTKITAMAGNAYVGSVYNIDVESQIYDSDGTVIAGTSVNITELEDLIMVEMEVPAHQQANYYAIAHVHNGVATLIPVEIIRGTDGESDKIRFYTEKFSTYAIVSSDNIIYLADGTSASVEQSISNVDSMQIPAQAQNEEMNPTAITQNAALYEEMAIQMSLETEPTQIVIMDTTEEIGICGYEPYIPLHSDYARVNDSMVSEYNSTNITSTEEDTKKNYLGINLVFFLLISIISILGVNEYVVLHKKEK